MSEYDLFNPQVTEKKTVNLNAQIEDVQCALISNGSASAVRLRFRNASRRTVIAVRMRGSAKNAFGETVTSDTGADFIVDFYGRTPPGEAGEMTSGLPSPTIRSIDLKWIKVSYEDGTIEDPLPPRIVEYEVPTFSDSPEDQEYQKLLGARYHTPINNLAVEVTEGWVCTCGAFNDADDDACAQCGMRHADALKVSDPQAREAILAEKRQRDIEERDRAEEAERVAERKLKRNKRIVWLVLVALCAILIIVKVSTDRQRAAEKARQEREAYMKDVRVFSSAQEMQKAINGKYLKEPYIKSTYYYHPTNEYLVINGDTATFTYVNTNQAVTDEVRDLIPEDGRFKIGYRQFKVNTDGSITYTYSGFSDVYDRLSGSTEPLDVQAMYDEEMAKQRARSETAYTALTLTVTSVRNDGSYAVCEGKVTNNGVNSYRFIKVKGAFVDRGGTVLDTDWTYAVGSEGLAPGETSTFRLSVKANRSITDCKLSMYN